MPVAVERIKEGILQNPDFQAFPGKTREESAYATAWQRFKQHKNNEAALKMANDSPTEKSYTSAINPDTDASKYPPKIGSPTTFENTSKTGEKAKMIEQDDQTKRVSTPPRTAAERMKPVEKQDDYEDLDANEKLDRLYELLHNLVEVEEEEHEEDLDMDEEEGEDYLEKLLKMLKKEKVRNPFAVATAQAKRMGYKDFAEGSPGREKRDKIAESLKIKKHFSYDPHKHKFGKLGKIMSDTWQDPETLEQHNKRQMHRNLGWPEKWRYSKIQKDGIEYKRNYPKASKLGELLTSHYEEMPDYKKVKTMDIKKLFGIKRERKPALMKPSQFRSNVSVFSGKPGTKVKLPAGMKPFQKGGQGSGRKPKLGIPSGVRGAIGQYYRTREPKDYQKVIEELRRKEPAEKFDYLKDIQHPFDVEKHVMTSKYSGAKSKKNTGANTSSSPPKPGFTKNPFSNRWIKHAFGVRMPKSSYSYNVASPKQATGWEKRVEAMEKAVKGFPEIPPKQQRARDIVGRKLDELAAKYGKPMPKPWEKKEIKKHDLDRSHTHGKDGVVNLW